MDAEDHFFFEKFRKCLQGWQPRKHSQKMKVAKHSARVITHLGFHAVHGVLLVGPRGDLYDVVEVFAQQVVLVE